MHHLRKSGLLHLLVAILISACTDTTDEEPQFETLTITATGGSMTPSFDPAVLHYAIRCAESDILRASAKTAAPMQVISVDGVKRGVGGAEIAITNLRNDQDFIIEVSQGQRTQRYTLHCIPLDVPDIDISVSTAEASQDLLYLSPRFVEDGERKSYLLILDNNGVPRFQRKIEASAGDFKRHANGLYTYALGVGQNEFGLNDYVIVVLDEDKKELERLATVGLTHTDNHDFLFTEEGNRIFISYNSVVRDMTAYGLSAEEVVGDSVIQELDADNNVVFEWSSWDYIDLSDCQLSGYPRFPSDYGHLNALSLTADGDLIGSFRGCAQVLRIDRPTGTVEWYLGGSRSTFSIVGDAFNEFCGQHTAWQRENGNVLMFDNGNYCLGEREETFGQFSRAVEYRLDSATGEAGFVRDYSLNGTYQEFTRSQGSVQPLPNGNWLIGWGRGPDVTATEITEAGEKVFELRLSIDGSTVVSYRAQRSP